MSNCDNSHHVRCEAGEGEMKSYIVDPGGNNLTNSTLCVLVNTLQDDCLAMRDALDRARIERRTCCDAMSSEHDRCIALEAAMRLIIEHQNTDIAMVALNPSMACRRCDIAATCDVAFDRYNMGSTPKVDCLATK